MPRSKAGPHFAYQARGGVARDVLGYQFFVGECDEQVYGHHALAGAGAAFHNEHVLLAGAGLGGQGEGGFVDYLLVVHHYKFLVALYHAGQAVGQALGRLYPALVYAVEELVPVAVFYVALYESLQLEGVGFEEDGGLCGVLGVERVVYYVVRLVIMEIGAGQELYLLVADGLVVVLYEALVAPGLVAGVGGFLRFAAEDGGYYGVFGGEVGVLPLL